MHIYIKKKKQLQKPNKSFSFQAFYFTLPSVHSKLDVYVACSSYFNLVIFLKQSKLMDGRNYHDVLLFLPGNLEVTLEVNTNFLSLTFNFLRVDGYLLLHSKIYKRYDSVRVNMIGLRSSIFRQTLS